MIPLNLLLAYQLENYKHLRFLKFIYSRPLFWIIGSKRQSLEYTPKAKLILFLTSIFFISDIFGSIYLFSWIVQIGALVITFISLPLYFVFACICLTPLDRFLKKKIIRQAKEKLSGFKDLQIIAITGSYGKTTTKEVLYTILSEKFEVLATQGTKNTPLGISRLILSDLTRKHQVFIVEMGAYEKGDIKELCDIVGPNISILTGITLQHLERFGNIENIIHAKFEILEALWKNDFSVVDSSTKAVQKWLQEKSLSVKNIVQVKKWIPYTYLENFWGIEFELEWKRLQTKLLSNYIIETLQICWQIWKKLWMDFKNFQSGVNKVDYIEHRMELIHNIQSNIYVIDDSFNGNVEWIRSIIDLLKCVPFSGRKIFVAGGVVELWSESDTVNSMLWSEIAEVADRVLLIKWPVGNALNKGLEKMWYDKNNVSIYETPLSLHEDIKNITIPWDVIVFQNDLPDNYL